MKMAIMVASDAGVRVAERIRQEWGQGEVEVFSVEEREGCVRVDSLLRFTQAHFNEYEVFVFVGAMGICVRAIAPCLKSKYVDPAVVNVDAEGRHVISVLSGHVGGLRVIPPACGHWICWAGNMAGRWNGLCR